MLGAAGGPLRPFGQTLGTRYRADGALVVALVPDRMIEIARDGTVNHAYATGLAVPNGVHADFDGNVWMTEFGGTRVLRITPDARIETVVSDSPETPVRSPNGIVFDERRRKLFYTITGADGSGEIWSVARADCSAPKPVKVIALPQQRLDGITLDACGHLYGVARDASQGRYGVYRVRLDGSGAASRGAEPMADIGDAPSIASSLQFGRGRGFDRKKLYVIGPQGVLYALPVGVPGAIVPGSRITARVPPSARGASVTEASLP